MKQIPLVFAVDDNYAPFLSVTLKSILENSSKEFFYKIFVLNSGLSKEHFDKLSEYNTSNSSIEYVDVAKRLNAISEKLHLRDYYTKTIYYRFFIPALFPQYDKALYLDSDLTVLTDISLLFNQDLGDNLVGAIPEEVMTLVKVFGDYSEDGLDIPREEYFNSGIMVMNLKKMREISIEDKFVELLLQHKFEVAPDQDYLNVICQNKACLLDLGWNKTPMENDNFNNDDLKIIHYKLASKPWHYDNVIYDEYFWKYAKMTNYYQDILKIKREYTSSQVEEDESGYAKLQQTAYEYIIDGKNYKKSKKVR